MDIGTYKIKFKIDNNIFNKDLELDGELIYSYSNNIQINFTTQSVSLDILFNLDLINTLFNISGRLEDGTYFVAFNCSFIKQTSKSKYILQIGKLYLNDKNILKKFLVKKALIKFSETPFFTKNETVFVESHQCSFYFDEFITIESKEEITLKDMDNIIFELNTFFQVLILNKDVTQIKKYFYKNDGKEVEEVLKYKEENKSIKAEFLINKFDKVDFTNVLNNWFIEKERYGKVFGYLSGILNENSFKYLEFKYLAVTQWIEGYSKIKYFTKEEIKSFKKIKKSNEKKIRKIINNIDNDEDKEFIKNHCEYKSEFTFRDKLLKLFEEYISNGIITFDDKNIKKFISNIIKHRNYRTHLNKDDDIDPQQTTDIMVILKNLIYVIVSNELKFCSKKIDMIINDINSKCINYEKDWIDK